MWFKAYISILNFCVDALSLVVSGVLTSFIIIVLLWFPLLYLFSSATLSRPTLWDPMGCSTPGFPVHHQLPELAETHVRQVDDAIQSSLPLHPLLLLPSIIPSIRISSKESVLHIKWPKYWSFSFSISPSNEYSGLISFRTDWFDLLAGQRTRKSVLQHYSSKA